MTTYKDALVPLTEARSRIYDLIRQVLPQRNVVLLRHGRPVGVLMDPTRYEQLLDRLETLEDEISVWEARASRHEFRSFNEIKQEEQLAVGEEAATYHIGDQSPQSPR